MTDAKTTKANMGTTEVTDAGEHATIAFRRTFRHPPETVWKAITDAAAQKKWLMADGTFDHRVGGHLDMIAGVSRFHVTGTVLAWDPPHVYEHEWNADPTEIFPQGERSVVRWELTPKDDGASTEIALTYKRLTVKTAHGFAPGLHVFLDRLEAQLANAPLPEWQGRFQEIGPLYWNKTARS